MALVKQVLTITLVYDDDKHKIDQQDYDENGLEAITNEPNIITRTVVGEPEDLEKPPIKRGRKPAAQGESAPTKKK
jgi:hypothetical protein